MKEVSFSLTLFNANLSKCSIGGTPLIGYFSVWISFQRPSTLLKATRRPIGGSLANPSRTNPPVARNSNIGMTKELEPKFGVLGNILESALCRALQNAAKGCCHRDGLKICLRDQHILQNIQGRQSRLRESASSLQVHYDSGQGAEELLLS